MGGGGSNAVIRMVEYGVRGVDFVVMNTDVQALARAPESVQTLAIGSSLTGGLGAGGKPAVGQEAAEESLRDIEKIVEGADMIFVTAGMGGGTGSGAAAVVANAAQRAGALTVGVVTRPFTFEGGQRRKQAAASIAMLKPNVDALITIANDKLLQILPESVPLNEALTCADDILRQGVVGISDIIIQPGLINVDFSDVRSVMCKAGTALMGIGSASGPNRAREAAERAVASPLLDIAVSQAKGAVFNIVGGPDLSLGDVGAAADVINDAMAPDSMIIFGALVDDRLQPGSDVTVTMVATGFVTDDGSDGFSNPPYSPIGVSTSSSSSGGAPVSPGAAFGEANAAVSQSTERDSGGSTDSGDDLPEFLTRLKRKRR